MTQNNREHVAEILEAADQSTQALVSDDDASGASLQEPAARANEFLESTDPDEILAAVGLDTLPDGSEPDTIPDAIARGEDDDLEELNRLLHLAKLAESTDEDALETAAGSLRERVEEDPDRDGDQGTTETGSDESTASSNQEDDGDDSLVDSITAAVGDSADDGGNADEQNVGEALESALESSLTEFGDEVQGLRDRLEAARTDTGDESGVADDETADEPSDEADETADEPTDEADETADEPTDNSDEDDGLLEMDVGDDDQRSSSRGVVRHSTMAPPPSDRPDMKGTARHSTIPDKND